MAGTPRVETESGEPLSVALTVDNTTTETQQQQSQSKKSIIGRFFKKGTLFNVLKFFSTNTQYYFL